MIRFFTSSLYFWGDGEISQNFAKNLTVPSFAPCRNQIAQNVKKGKYSFERGIIALHFGEKICKSPFQGGLAAKWLACWTQAQ